jgi:prepilin peptidase CpaA
MEITSFNPAIPITAFLVLAALACSAALWDVSSRRIPNLLVLVGAALGLLSGLYHQGLAGVTQSLLGLLTGMGLFLPGYLLRMTGGGDLKLMAALGSLLGPLLTLKAFFLYILFGLVWALLYALFAWARQGAELPLARYGAMLRTLMRTGQFSYIRPKSNEALGRRLPMAPAIALGAIIAPLLFTS